MPWLAMVVYTSSICIGGDRDAVADRDRPHAGVGVVALGVERRCPTTHPAGRGRSAARSRTRRGSATRRRRAELVRDLDRAHVRRLGEDVGDGHRRRVLLDVLEVGATDVDALAHAVEHGVGRDHALLDRARHRDHLVGRAGLVHVGDGPVALRRGRRRAPASVSVAPSTVAIASTSPVCTSTTIAVPPRAFIDVDALQQRLLGVPLQRRVDGEHDVLPALRRRHLTLAARDVVALRVTLHLHAARACR